MKRGMRKSFLTRENDYYGELHMAIKELIINLFHSLVT